MSIAGLHIRDSLLAFLQIQMAEIPHVPLHRELHNFRPLTTFLRNPADPSSTLIPFAATPPPPTTNPTAPRPSWVVWCVRPTLTNTSQEAGLHFQLSKSYPTPTGKYSLKNLNQDGTPRFIPVPFSEYLKVTCPCPQTDSTLNLPPPFRSTHTSIPPKHIPLPLKTIIPSNQSDVCPSPSAKRHRPSRYDSLLSQSSTSLPQNPSHPLPTTRKRSASPSSTQGDLCPTPSAKRHRPSRYATLLSQSFASLPQNPSHPLLTTRKRSAPPLPHQYCSKCWKFGSEVGSHWDAECSAPEPIACPADFAAQREAASLFWVSSGRPGRANPNPSLRNRKRTRKAPPPTLRKPKPST